MKKFLTSLILVALLLCAAQLQAAILIGSLSSIITAQTNTPTLQTNSAYLSINQISVSNNGLAITNAYIGSFRFSLDNGSTWFTNNSPQFNPAVTNAGTTTISAQSITLPIQVQMVAITNTANTTLIQIGVTSP